MPRASVLTQPEKHTLNFERALFAEAMKRAAELGYSGSEYICRLVNADLKRKRSMSRLGARTFKPRVKP